MSERVLENALRRELEAAEVRLREVLTTAARDLAGQGGSYSSARLAARFALERINFATTYYDEVEAKLKAVQHQGASLVEPSADSVVAESGMVAS